MLKSYANGFLKTFSHSLAADNYLFRNIELFAHDVLEQLTANKLRDMLMEQWKIWLMSSLVSFFEKFVLVTDDFHYRKDSDDALQC